MSGGKVVVVVALLFVPTVNALSPKPSKPNGTLALG